MSAYAQKRYNFKFKPPVKVAKPNIVHVPKEQWQKEKRHMFIWADNQIAKHGYNGNTASVLKELINCTSSKGVTYATLETIHNRLIARYGKAAPSRRTIDNCIARLVAGKSIKRYTQDVVKSLIKTRLLMGKLATDSTQLLRTEYISTKKDIYIREGDNSSIAAFPSTNNRNIQKPSHKTASAATLIASPLAVNNVIRNTQEQQLEILRQIKAAQGR